MTIFYWSHHCKRHYYVWIEFRLHSTQFANDSVRFLYFAEKPNIHLVYLFLFSILPGQKTIRIRRLQTYNRCHLSNFGKMSIQKRKLHSTHFSEPIILSGHKTRHSGRTIDRILAAGNQPQPVPCAHSLNLRCDVVANCNLLYTM